MNNKEKIAITTGDPNGIGAEITIKALRELNLSEDKFVLISNVKVLDYYGYKVGHNLINIDFKEEVTPGILTKGAGEFCFQCLKKACELAKNKEIKAIVTAPVAKEAMHLAGHKFNGQTEVLQHFLANGREHAEMLFISNDFRVLLLTRHIAIKDIHLDKDKLIEKISDINKFFKTHFNIANPKFALCAFNPHAGEHGILGKEEQEILIPMVEELTSKGINITQPLPADTLFIDGVQAYLNNAKLPYDCYLACYHDQGLIPIKSVAGKNTVNTTIGLEVIRTSPSHGTAFDIAGKNIASADSMIAAIKQVL